MQPWNDIKDLSFFLRIILILGPCPSWGTLVSEVELLSGETRICREEAVIINGRCGGVEMFFFSNLFKVALP